MISDIYEKLYYLPDITRALSLLMTKRTLTLGKETGRGDVSSSSSNKNQETCMDLQEGHTVLPVEIENLGT